MRAKVMHTHHVLAVRDLAASTSYFLDRLGFERSFEVEGWSFLRYGDFRVMLGHCPEEVPASDTHNHSYFAHVMLDDARAAFVDMQARGATFLFELEAKSWGLLEFGITTPEGHRMVFAQEMAADASSGA